MYAIRSYYAIGSSVASMGSSVSSMGSSVMTGDDLLFCSSADWMPRNFFSRVEVCFPIDEKRPRDQIIKFGLQVYLSDNSQAWILQNDGSYKRAKLGSHKP